MKVKSAIAFLFLSLMMGLPVRLGGQAITSSSESVLEGIPKNLEVRLALSALPPLGLLWSQTGGDGLWPSLFANSAFPDKRHRMRRCLPRRLHRPQETYDRTTALVLAAMRSRQPRLHRTPTKRLHGI